VSAVLRRMVLVRALPVAVAVLAAAVAGCSDAFYQASPTTPVGVATGAAPTTTAGPVATLGPPPIETPDDAAPVTIDPTLLEILPEKIGTIPVQEDGDTAALALSDPALDRIATGIDSAVAVDAGNGDLVVANIVRLRPGAFGAEIYRQWRDSFDEGACAASGGVVGHAEAQIADRQTYVTSCVGSMHTYHLWLEDEGVLISASSIGDDRFGEQLLQGLRLPS
jgi:hypothetical protein